MWTASSATSRTGGSWLFFPLFGVPFLLIGLGMLAAPLWAYLRTRGTVYAVTEGRAVIILGGGARG